jgi:hypothetical protein
MLTKTRGSDRTNIVAMLISIVTVLIVGRVEMPWLDAGELVQHGKLVLTTANLGGWLPAGFPNIAFSWWVFIGCAVCFVVSSIFRTPERQLEKARVQLERVQETKIG